MRFAASDLEMCFEYQVSSRFQASSRRDPPLGPLSPRRASPCSSAPTPPGVASAVLTPCLTGGAHYVCLSGYLSKIANAPFNHDHVGVTTPQQPPAARIVPDGFRVNARRQLLGTGDKARGNAAMCC